MQVKKKIIFIFNPKAGKGIHKTIKYLAETEFPKEKFEIAFRETEFAGHATQIANEAVKNKTDIVACIGGDGTVNETARALVHSSGILAIIPTGSGNGLARHLSIPVDPAQALRLIHSLNTTTIDTFTVNGHLGVNVAGVGFDAYVAHRFSQGKSRGFINYVRCVIEAYPSFSGFTVNAEEGLHLKNKVAWLVSFANSSQFGNNAFVAPNANCSDGILDITVCQKINILKAPSFAYKLFHKKLRENPTIQFIKTQETTLVFGEEIPLHIDGEPVGNVNQVHVKINPASLRVIIP